MRDGPYEKISLENQNQASVGMFAEPEAAPTNPLTRVAGAADAVRIEAPQGTPGAMESCGALIAQQSSGRDLEILLDVLTQTEMA